MTGISKYIRDQFPAFYQEGGDEFITFLEAYYEFLENSPEYNGRVYDIRKTNDVDTALEDFIKHFKLKYLSEFPYVSAVDHQFVVKHIMDYYKSKGSEKSAKLLLKLLLGQETEVYYPGQDVLKPSDSKWVKPYYLELSREARTRNFVNKQITGSSSKATAFVESIVTKRVDGKLIDIVFLSDVRGLFRVNEVVTDDGTLRNAPRVIGSMTTITIDLGGRNNRVGDVFNVESSGGRKGKVRVTETIDATGRVDFRIEDGGWGYEVNGRNDVKVSSAVLVSENPNLHFVRGEVLVQPQEQLNLYSATALTSNLPLESTIRGYNASNVHIATGKVISTANADSEWNVIGEDSANAIITVYPTMGTFGKAYRINTTNAHSFKLGHEVDAAGSLTMEISPEVGSFAVGDVVYQRRYLEHPLPGSNTNVQALISESQGRITAINGIEIQLDRVFGDFKAGTAIRLGNNSKTANVAYISNTVIGGHGIVTNVANTTSFFLGNITGDFVAGDFVKGRGPAQKVVASVVDEGVAQVTKNAAFSTIAVVDTSANVSVTAQVVGQNTSAFGVHGNTSPIAFNIGNANAYPLLTQREKTMISPPRHANGSVIELSVGYTQISTGVGAGFNVGSIENEETVTMNTDFLGDKNVANVPYMEIRLNGEGSSIGFLDSINVVSAGTTLYSNNQIVELSAGGYANGDPIENAQALITTHGNGALRMLTVTNHGMGYYQMPTHNLVGDAQIKLNMSYGYGFPKTPHGTENTALDLLLTIDTFTVGAISSLTRINPGVNYNMNPFVWVNNKWISAQGRRNYYMIITNLSGAFASGERLYQMVDGVRYYKGEVISSSTNGILVKRVNVNVGLTNNATVYGAVTDSRAVLVGYYEDADSDPLGDNANIVGNVISANGIATAVEVIDSGYGYVDGNDATLVSEKGQFVITGKVNVKNQGRGQGYWKTTTSHLNSEKRLHDNRYYQEFSYDIRCGLSLDKYEAMTKKMIHVAGTRMFGTFIKNVILKEEIKVKKSAVTLGEVAFNPLTAFKGQLGFIHDSKLGLKAFKSATDVAGGNEPIYKLQGYLNSPHDAIQATSSFRPVISSNKSYVAFDGTDDFLTISASDAIGGTPTGTVGIRFRTRKTALQSLFGCQGGGTVSEFQMLVTAANIPQFRRGGNGNTISGPAIQTNEWYTAFATWNGNVAKFYFNGVLVGTNEIGGANVAANNIYFGAHNSKGQPIRYFGGDVSDFFIIDREFSESTLLGYKSYWG